MAKYLVIVESPAKVKTVKKYLGANYEVAASMGHVRDLPKSRLGIDVEHDFEPKYITIRGKGELLASLRKAAKKADKVYLATDPDREGEAISWHLSIALNLDENKMRRITFNEITKSAAFRYGIRVTWIRMAFSCPTSCWNWRIASKNGWLSISPTVPPTSMMAIRSSSTSFPR